MTSQYDIFLSYSHRDSPLAQSLYSKLTDAGLRCFMAEKDIAAGELWEGSVRDAIRSAQPIAATLPTRWVHAGKDKIRGVAK